MAGYADLEIGLHRRGEGRYAAELRFMRANEDAYIDLLPRDARPRVRLNFNGLRQRALNPKTYGELLTDSLFEDPALKEAFAVAQASAQENEATLRLRLCIDSTAPELHSLRWETLRDPNTRDPMLTGERVVFSRLVSSRDLRPVQLRAAGELRVLVVIANPCNLPNDPHGLTLAPLDVATEAKRAQEALGDLRTEVLATPGAATLEAIAERLRSGCDVLYLICHGALIGDEPWLWLEDANGDVDRVAGAELVTRIREVRQAPRLIVLASCQSAGTGATTQPDDEATHDDDEDVPRPKREGALAALGPQLAEAGVPAVLAMQGDVTVQTAAAFLSTFFRELLKDRPIDLAVSLARGAVRERPDSWMPVLFMRLRSGLFWYQPHLASRGDAFDSWNTLCTYIREGTCTPILGPGLSARLLGSQADIARRWAESYQFPMASDDRDQLPQVAQFIAGYRRASGVPAMEYRAYLRQRLRDQCGEELPADLQEDGVPIERLIAFAGERLRASDPDEPHSALARLPFPIYLTTNSDNLLADALLAAGKVPEVELCRWNDETERVPTVFKRGTSYYPSVKRPLIYQLFGRLEQPSSLVLSEDNYFDFLIGFTRNRPLVPKPAAAALTDTALLFLGFQLDDWDFRVLFRTIMAGRGNSLLSTHSHVAVQIAPDEDRMLAPERARKYLETYFGQSAISIYWGSLQDFMHELQQQLNRTQRNGAP